MKQNRFLSWLLLWLLLLSFCSCSAPAAAGTQQTSVSGTPPPYDGIGLRVDFLDVGQADSALVRCGDDAMLIDGGNVADSSYVVSYLDAQGVSTLNYLVATHAHEDHAGGLSGPLNTCTVEHVYCSVDAAEGKFFSDFQKYTAAQGLSIEIPQVGDSWTLGDATVTVLGPVRTYEDPNNSSLILRVQYKSTSFLFTGDMEETAEADLLTTGADLSATVLKVSHHGSATSTSATFLEAVAPTYGVISVGLDNSYGHPAPELLDRLQDYGVETYRTSDSGNISFLSDGTNIRIFTESQEALPSPSATETDSTYYYIGNVNSQVFHRPDCPNLPMEKNQIRFDSRQEAVDAGFRPCGNCNP